MLFASGFKQYNLGSHNVERMTEVRLIALWNVLYKILEKVLTNRLKSILPVTISEYQSTFISDRSITNNVLIAFEIIHYIKRNNTSQEREVTFKLDISKPYDRVD